MPAKLLVELCNEMQDADALFSNEAGMQKPLGHLAYELTFPECLTSIDTAKMHNDNGLVKYADMVYRLFNKRNLQLADKYWCGHGIRPCSHPLEDQPLCASHETTRTGDSNSQPGA